jgi:hypothetical protein
MNDLLLPGPLDEFLEHPPSRAEPGELRRDLLQRTVTVVRRRRWLRRLVAVGALAAAVLLSALGMWLGVPRETKHVDSPVTDLPKTPATAVESPAPAAVAMEWEAFDAPRSDQPALYLKAGDRYAEEDHDLSSAVRCYGQAVRTAEKVEVDPNDNWLVMALKIDEIERRKEK